MPRRFFSMSDLLWATRRTQDRRITAALDEARARRDLGLERLGHPLKTKTRRAS